MEQRTANNKQVGGQSINIGAEQYLVRGLGLVGNSTDIGTIVLAERNGAPVYVRDVATVKEAPALRFGAVTRDGKGPFAWRSRASTRTPRTSSTASRPKLRRPRPLPRASQSRSTTAPTSSTRR